MTNWVEGIRPRICPPLSFGRRGKNILRKAEIGLRLRKPSESAAKAGVAVMRYYDSPGA